MPPTELAMSLGKKIRAIRTAKDMKITEMARLSGLTTSMISQMERGLISPSIETLKKIGNVLDVPLSFLFETEGERRTRAIRCRPNRPCSCLGHRRWYTPVSAKSYRPEMGSSCSFSIPTSMDRLNLFITFISRTVEQAGNNTAIQAMNVAWC